MKGIKRCRIFYQNEKNESRNQNSKGFQGNPGVGGGWEAETMMKETHSKSFILKRDVQLELN